MKIGVIGINHKLAQIDLREKIALALNLVSQMLKFIDTDILHITLSTCNRTEFFFSSKDLTATHALIISLLRQKIAEEFEQKLYSFFGFDCFLHLCRVSLGLDSAIIGETEIAGQVKRAYEAARTAQNLNFDLHFLFQKNLAISKKIRSKFCQPPNLKFNQNDNFFYQIAKIIEQTSPQKTLIVGASEINKKIIARLSLERKQSLFICNRTNEKAAEIAKNQQINFWHWSELKSWPEFELIILGTNCNQYLITKPNIAIENIKTKLILDLGLPRNADPSLSSLSLKILDIDTLQAMTSSAAQKNFYETEAIEKSILKQVKAQVELFKLKQTRCAQLRRVGIITS